MDQNHKMALTTGNAVPGCWHFSVSTSAASGHIPAASMSCMDLLTVLYFGVMRIDPRRPSCPRPRPLRAVQGPLYPRPVFRAGTAGLSSRWMTCS